MSFDFIMFPGKGAPGLLSDRRHIACFNSVLDQMCGAQFPRGRTHVGNCTTTPVASQFYGLSSIQYSFLSNVSCDIMLIDYSSLAHDGLMILFIKLH